MRQHNSVLYLTGLCMFVFCCFLNSLSTKGHNRKKQNVFVNMLLHYFYKLASSVKRGKRRVTRFFKNILSVVFLFNLFRNFVRKIRAKFVNKENVTVVEIQTVTFIGNRYGAFAEQIFHCSARQLTPLQLGVACLYHLKNIIFKRNR